MTETQNVTIDIKRLSVILGIILALSGAIYKTYSVTTGYLDTLATKVEVQQSEINSSIELVTVTMMGYEDELIGYDFLIETDQATPADRVAKANVERRIQSLKEKLDKLELRSINLQSGSDVVGSQIE
ncbi:MAG: hypothetical protein ACTSPB_23310 [Candidatus Thorarchaeota archaeon]